MTLITLLVLAVLFVAFTNGANANFKGVASLYGSGTTPLRQAALWGTLMTFAGSIASLFLAQGLLQAFSGKGIVAKELTQSPEFVCGVAFGAALTSFLATRLGFPVSTTHALVGAITGAGLASGQPIEWKALVSAFVIPLFFSPLVALVLGTFIYQFLRAVRLAPDQRTLWLDSLHFLSTGAASFARGLNDTPKMAAMLLLVTQLHVATDFVLIAVLIALGGIFDSRRVAETLGKKITDMNPSQGFAASLVTAGLVTTASLHSWPVSTTHVSVGSLLGIGIATHQARWRMAIEIIMAWVSTVPCGAMLAALFYLSITQF